MGDGRRFLWQILLWAAVIVETTMSTNVTSVSTTETHSQMIRDTSSTGYAWSAWGQWTLCSRTCGGGVAYQERQCLPRGSSDADGTLPPPIVTVRVSRQIRSADCVGETKRYRECNTEPCPGFQRGLRAEQCAVYDRKPFRGRFYTWVPYIDGDHPCLLNCRPLGQQFYASLSIVADGTPCTKPGARAMCFGGVCKVVGREALMVGATKEMRCGRRLVSGLFSRPRLPLGYTYVTTVPSGACRLNVSEITGGENYIALKILNGSFIMNGEFAVSSPGNYEAAGARFLYTRAAGLDQVYAVGPILQPIDIMILYTQPNPTIKYEYFTESLNGETDDDAPRSDAPDFPPPISTKHSRRHHTSVEPPGKVSMRGDECLEFRQRGICSALQWVPAGRAETPLREYAVPPRWRAAAWSACPKCGPASRKRIVGCVQDHSRGITKISDQKCPPLRPHTSERCNIPNCDDTNISNVRHIEPKRVKPREHTDTFRDGPVYTVTVNGSDAEIGPEYSFGAVGGWLFTDWSECVGWCVGGGVKTRGVRCADPSGCMMQEAPETFRTCTPKIECAAMEGKWFVAYTNKTTCPRRVVSCSSTCNGKQIRGVLCIGGTGRHLRDSACAGARPSHERQCGSNCSPTWYFSEWDKCTGNCSPDGKGFQRRSVVCAPGESNSEGVASDADCASGRPAATRACEARCDGLSTIPPDLTIESQKVQDHTTSTTTQKVVTRESVSKDCEDKLPNCGLAVQARLCHYNYYIENCCDSCRGR